MLYVCVPEWNIAPHTQLSDVAHRNTYFNASDFYLRYLR